MVLRYQVKVPPRYQNLLFDQAPDYQAVNRIARNLHRPVLRFAIRN
jgi:hypothetical protein